MKNLRSIVDELKSLFRPKRIDYDRIYEALREIDMRTTGRPLPCEEEAWEADFIAKHGTKEEFIKERKKIKEE